MNTEKNRKDLLNELVEIINNLDYSETLLVYELSERLKKNSLNRKGTGKEQERTVIF